jgi:hypothetical protein
MAVAAQRLSPAYERIERLIADDVAVILDGGNATELGREHAGQLRDGGCTRSTSTAARSRTRSRTRFGTASPSG